MENGQVPRFRGRKTGRVLLDTRAGSPLSSCLSSSARVGGEAPVRGFLRKLPVGGSPPVVFIPVLEGQISCLNSIDL